MNQTLGKPEIFQTLMKEISIRFASILDWAMAQYPLHPGPTILVGQEEHLAIEGVILLQMLSHETLPRW